MDQTVFNKSDMFISRGKAISPQLSVLPSFNEVRRMLRTRDI